MGVLPPALKSLLHMLLMMIESAVFAHQVDIITPCSL